MQLRPGSPARRDTHGDLLDRLIGDGLSELRAGRDTVDRRLPAGVASELEGWVA